jgi:translation initiation factor 2 alpha subunit (eIF-2alpha)
MEFQIYYNNEPFIHEIVLVKFTERTSTHIEGELLEYNYKGMMSYNDATKRKKVYSWNKTVPLNKPLVARVEEVYTDTNYVQLSIAYFDESKIEHMLKLLNNNKILYSIIKKLCTLCEIEFKQFWYNIIHEVDKKRKEEQTEEGLLDAFIDNIEYVNELIKEKYENSEEIILTLEILNNNKHHKIESRFGLISNEGLSKIKDMLSYIIENQKWKYTLKYDAAPYYILESNSENSTLKDHEEFIEMINNKHREYNIFIKIEYIGKV